NSQPATVSPDLVSEKPLPKPSEGNSSSRQSDSSTRLAAGLFAAASFGIPPTWLSSCGSSTFRESHADMANADIAIRRTPTRFMYYLRKVSGNRDLSRFRLQRALRPALQPGPGHSHGWTLFRRRTSDPAHSAGPGKI